MTSQVVLTGLGAISPVGNDRETTWRRLVAGASGVRPISAFDASELSVRIAAEVQGFDPATVFTGKRLRRSARFSQLAVAAAREAVADAGLELRTDADRPDADRPDPDGEEDRAAVRPRRTGESPERVGVVVNAAVAGFDTIEAATRSVLGNPEHPLSPYFVSSSLTNMPACEVAIDLGVHGPVNASALACASGSYALLEARRLILTDEADVVICGGTDAAITPVMFRGLIPMGAMSRRNDDPTAASRPFDADRDGFVFGEGAVIAVLESAEHAARRGARAYASIAGGALTADAFHVSAPEPEGRYAARAIELALQRSGIDAGDLDYVCAHGTSTKANDRTESAALRAALGASAYDVAVSGPKSMVGHMIGAAGALGSLVCALAIRDGIVPPTLNLETPDPECDLDYVPKVARRMPVNVALANAFGFGGQNVVVAFTAPPDELRAPAGPAGRPTETGSARPA